VVFRLCTSPVLICSKFSGLMRNSRSLTAMRISAPTRSPRRVCIGTEPARQGPRPGVQPRLQITIRRRRWRVAAIRPCQRRRWPRPRRGSRPRLPAAIPRVGALKQVFRAAAGGGYGRLFKRSRVHPRPFRHYGITQSLKRFKLYSAHGRGG
jgi:hypothetical protein